MKPLAPNTLIQGRYLIVHLIGKGGMGEVYLAVDQRLGSAIALKRTYFAGDEMLGNAFEREARTLARMRHPVLPKVSDHFGEGEEQYLVMEHIAGDDLAKRLEGAQKPFPVSWVMFWADQLLDALSYLHSHEPPIIHRDIKPQNLKLTDENHIILLDFGLSKTSTGQTHISNTGSTGSVVGYTPHYAPMEQIRGIGTNARSDLYSLSATLYQLMTNVVPPDALSRADTMLNGMSDPIEPPHQLNPEISAAVSEVIIKGLEVSQERRFANAREMQKALRRAFTEMQEAMAAQTVAFNLGEVVATEDKTHVMPSVPLVAVLAAPDPTPSVPPAPVAVPSEIPLDLDATLAFDPLDSLERDRNADSQPAVSAPVLEAAEVVPPVPPVPFDGGSQAEQNSFVTVAAGKGSAFEASDVTETPVRAERPALARSSSVAAKKSSSRVFAIVGGLGAILVLGLGAAGAGWYLYNNYSAASVVAEPTPSPEATVAESPLPEPSAEVSSDTNSSTDPGTSAAFTPETNSADPNSISTPTVPSTRTPADTSTSRPVNPGTRPAVNRPATTPAVRATPKPKANPGRTDILQ